MSLDGLTLARGSNALSGEFAIEEHTDAKGSEAYNLDLSLRRARTFVRFLSERGVSAGGLVPSGKGCSELATPEDPYAAANRRVRIRRLE